jgi:hypothetical protein
MLASHLKSSKLPKLKNSLSRQQLDSSSICVTWSSKILVIKRCLLLCWIYAFIIDKKLETFSFSLPYTVNV